MDEREEAIKQCETYNTKYSNHSEIFDMIIRKIRLIIVI